MTAEQDQWHHNDLVITVHDLLMDHVDEPYDVLAQLIVDAVEDWCLDQRFTGREKWLRFNAWRRRGVAND